MRVLGFRVSADGPKFRVQRSPTQVCQGPLPLVGKAPHLDPREEGDQPDRLSCLGAHVSGWEGVRV